jgi:hypothetical protein
VRKHNLRALRHVVAVVPQEPFLFAASIRDNITYGHDGVTEVTFSSGTSVVLFYFNGMLFSVYGSIFRWYFTRAQTFNGILRRLRYFNATQPIFPSSIAK